MVLPNRDMVPFGLTMGGWRPTTVAAPAAATPELSDQPCRRTFTVQDKLRVLAEIDRAPAGGTGATLRRGNRGIVSQQLPGSCVGVGDRSHARKSKEQCIRGACIQKLAIVTRYHYRDPRGDLFSQHSSH
jgi:hypothetical protein